MNVSTSYLESIKKQFLYYKTLGEKAITQLEPDQLFVTLNEDTNSIAIIVKYLYGKKYWTMFQYRNNANKRQLVLRKVDG